MSESASTPEFTSRVVQLTSTWPGFGGITHLMVFGGSYCTVGYSVGTDPHPTPANPLGIPFPGLPYRPPHLTGARDPNWVGHLITKYSPGANYVQGTKRRGFSALIPGVKASESRGSDSPLIVFDFAKSGARVPDVESQISNQFISQIGSKPSWAAWTAESSLFVTWVGINDCAFVSEPNGVVDVVRALFVAQEKLYQAGARNFLFVDVPPIKRSPAGLKSKLLKPTIHPAWNTALRDAAQKFALAHDGASVMIFSSWDTFTRILDDAASYGFDANAKFGGIWIDHLHPTTKVHDILAREISTCLNGAVKSGVSEGLELGVSSSK
ncbi:carbohydrate esterase family 16 protein [Hydnomerulius pinastri MD-312]|uniref:Carbohydrate esterase family 16 protein n=1 Tax=Hydnomerulius pinastri MD-312 TaxID=994086 RepID=A0A0C9VQ71_9AGAM|nr:carbohydrate esterase family 16 protein [Hydnomerulius pinastri MD-312]